MSAYSVQFEPFALKDDIVELLPDGEYRRIESVEPLAEIGPVSFGTIASGETATTSTGQLQVEVDAVEMQKNQLGQYRLEPLSPVDVKVNQDNRRDERLNNANRRGRIRTTTPGQAAEVFVLGNGLPYLEVENPNPYDLQDAYVVFLGFKFNLQPNPVPEPDVDSQPRAVPIDKLEQRTQGGR